MNLTNTARTDSQYELETFSVQEGVRKYREALAKGGHADVPAGQQLIKAALQPMELALQAWLLETAEGLASRSAGTFHFINQLEPAAVAWLTAHSAIHMLHERPSLAKVSVALAMQLEAAINVDAICEANPRLGSKVAKRISTMSADRNKLVFIRKGADMVDVKVIQWDETTRARVGALLLTMFAQSTGLVAIETVTTGRNRSATIVRPTESCLKWLEVSHARCELLAPLRMPMVCKPRPWSNPFNGGYLTKELRQPLVKTRNRGYLTELKEWDMPHVYGSVNALQGTEWSINTKVYQAIKGLLEENRTDGGLPLREELPMPAKSWTDGEEPSEEVLHAWKVEAAKTWEARIKLVSKRAQLHQTLFVSEKMMEKGNRFHFVYNMDWRGRLYPVSAGLNPQGDDLAKSLLMFAEGMPLGDEGAYWLAIHGANSRGVDKVSFQERIEWVEEHTKEILACAANPGDTADFWAATDENGRFVGSPFVFLSFCMEYAALDRWVAAGGDQETFKSTIPVAFDGSCNGLQNFSAMLRDPIGGAATGLVPSEKPADIYSVVAQAAQAIIDHDASHPNDTRIGSRAAAKATAGKPAKEAREGTPTHLVAARWVGKMTRKLAKRNTMTVPYGVTGRGMRDQMFKELVGSAPEHRSNDAEYLASCNYMAIGNVVVAARLAMDWLQAAAKVAASNQLPVRWETPMGLLVVQDYRTEEGDEMNFTCLGRRYRFMLQRTGDKLNTRKQALGISPNFVHSLDAAHLMLTVNFCTEDGMKDFAMIHDSYGCHAGQASLLRDNLRDAFVEQYSLPVLEQFRDALAEQLPAELRKDLPELPPMGTLDLEQVKQSEYFFA